MDLIHFGKQKITFFLRAIPLLFEDRNNIVWIFLEQIKRLVNAVKVHPIEIWRKICNNDGLGWKKLEYRRKNWAEIQYIRNKS